VFFFFGLHCGYVNWFRSYLTKKQSPVLSSGDFPSPFEVLSGVPQGSVLGPLFFCVYVFVTYVMQLATADDIKTYPSINSPKDHDLLQSGNYFIRGWCTVNCTEICTTVVVILKGN
jgi:hypothetical protein